MRRGKLFVRTVPESRLGLSDRTIEIAVAIIRTPSEEPASQAAIWRLFY